MLKLRFYYFLYNILTYFIEWSFEHGSYSLEHKLYCWRVKVNKKLCDTVINRHIKKDWKK